MSKVKTRKFGSKEWYKDETRHMVQKVNERFWRAKKEGKMTEQLKQEEARLIKYGSQASITAKNRGETVGLGFHKNPSIEMLKRQYQELRRFLKTDIWTSEGEKEEEDREDRAYKAFNEWHPDWSKEKWRDFVQLLGNAPTEILNAFSYERSGSHKGSKKASYNTKNEGFIEAFSFAYDNDIDLFRVMQNVYKDIDGKGFGQEEALDALKEEIKREIAEK